MGERGTCHYTGDTGVRGGEIIQLTVDPSVSRQDIADNVTPSHLTIACDAMCDANLCGFSDEIIKKIQS